MKINSENRNTLMAVLAIGLFIVFDIAGLSLNYLLSRRIDEQAIGINLAGRQRMLSQRMVKTLLQIDAARRAGEPAKTYYDELKLSFDLFDNTLRGFDVGNETKGGAGETLFLPAVTEPKARKAVSDAVVIWKDYRVKVAGLLASGERSDETAVQAVLAEAKASNLKLLGLMNALTTELEILTQQEAQRIRIYQVLAFVLALAFFAWAFVLFRRRDAEVLLARQLATETARAESDYLAALVARTTEGLQTAEDLHTLSHQLFAALATPMGIGCAAFFRYDAESATLEACGHYGLAGDIPLPQQIALDEGLVGECARAQRRMVIADLPDSHLKVHTALMNAAPRAILLLPVVSSGALLGVIEMALLHMPDARHEEVLKAILPLLAMRIEIIARNERTQNLLQASQQQAAELAAQQEHIQGLLGEQEALFNNAPIGILYTGAGRIQRANPAMTALFGWSPEEFVGAETIIMFSSQDDYRSFGATVGPGLAAGKAVHVEWHFVRADGTPFRSRVSAKGVTIAGIERASIWILEEITKPTCASNESTSNGGLS